MSSVDDARHIFNIIGLITSSFFFFKETLLVHKDLVQTGGLNDLILELQEKGEASSSADYL